VPSPPPPRTFPAAALATATLATAARATTLVAAREAPPEDATLCPALSVQRELRRVPQRGKPRQHSGLHVLQGRGWRRRLLAVQPAVSRAVRALPERLPIGHDGVLQWSATAAAAAAAAAPAWATGWQCLRWRARQGRPRHVPDEARCWPLRQGQRAQKVCVHLRRVRPLSGRCATTGGESHPSAPLASFLLASAKPLRHATDEDG